MFVTFAHISFYPGTVLNDLIYKANIFIFIYSYELYILRAIMFN
jgi:hypothetical protein